MTLADLNRFRKILGLLGSDHVGERASAALLASNFLRERGFTWSSVSLPVVVDGGARRVSDDLERAVRRANPSRADRAEKRAAWKERSYGADSDGFETGRK